MGNVRNPVGPLPASIYWRRRAVVVCLLALLAALIVVAVNSLTGGSGTGGGTRSGLRGGAAKHPADGSGALPSITPGPSSTRGASGTAPGGRDTSDPTGASAAKNGGSSPGIVNPSPIPARSSLTDCDATQLRLRVMTSHPAYDVGQRPEFTLTAVNTSATACRIDVASTAAVFTITDARNQHVWSSADCPADRSPYLLRVPGGGSVSYTVSWNRATSEPQCATPSSSDTATPGVYEIHVMVDGLGPAQAPFTLNQYGS